MARGYLFKPPGAGRRVTTTHPPDRDMNTHVGYLRMNHLSAWAGSAGWPDWEWPFLAWAERNGYGVDVISNADLPWDRREHALDIALQQRQQIAHDHGQRRQRGDPDDGKPHHATSNSPAAPMPPPARPPAPA